MYRKSRRKIIVDFENTIFANRRSHRDFVKNAFLGLTREPCHVNIASAFFTEADVLKELVDKGCTIHLVVRMDYPTFPGALRKALAMEAVQVRYVTDSSFHPKLYMFGDEGALVGSANLTRKGLGTNQEIMVFIPSSDLRHEELARLFSEYWGQARVLRAEDVDKYQRAFDRRRQAMSELDKLSQDIEDELGRVVISNIERGLPKQKPENAFVDDYRRTYQEFLAAFEEIRKVYETDGRRKYPEEIIPVRLEIDAFMSYVREEYAGGENWRVDEAYAGEERRKRVAGYVDKWHNDHWAFFHDTVVPKWYPAVMQAFSSKKSIMEADDDILFNGLNSIHSFYDRKRFFKGGTETMRKEFFAANDDKRIRSSLAYLLHGKDEIVERMANLIFHSDYGLTQFGRSNVQELVGWCNKEGLPVVNSRTTKIMHFFGFQVTQIG